MENSNQLIWYVIPTLIAVAILVIAVFLEFGARKNIAIKKLAEVLKSGAFLSPTILSIIIGILLIFSGLKDFIFAPGLELGDSLFYIILKIAQIVIGIGLVLGIFIRLMTLGLIALFIASFFTFPALSVLDYLIFVGIAIFLFLVHRDALSFSFFFHPVQKNELFDKYRKYAVPILRFIAGFGLAYAAFHHNILRPEPAIAFLEQKPLLNFMQSILGIESYSNAFLVFHAGILGILMGILLAFGLLERFTSSLIAIGLLLSVFIGGWYFLPISLPYFAVIYVIITGNQFEGREKVEKG